MPSSTKLSVYAAILINLNIMIGAGVFINAVALAHFAGFIGFLTYGLVGIILLPLILAMDQMVNLYPEGSFLAYGKHEISPLAGFIGAWSYFIGKLGSAALLIHAGFLLLQQNSALLATIPVLLLDAVAIGLFITLNMLNLRSGKIIQAWLMIFKLVPVLFIIFAGMTMFDVTQSTVTVENIVGLGSCIPLVLYAFLGFEATCSLSSNIENPQRNGPIAICVSYGLVVVLYMAYQLCLFGALGSALSSFDNFLGVFPAFVTTFFGAPQVMFQKLLNCAVSASALGGAYGVFLSNCWNMRTLAEANYVPFSAVFKKLNNHAIPYAAVILEGVICLAYLLISDGNQIALQLTSVSGSILAYTISVIGLFIAYRTKSDRIVLPMWVCSLALVSCLVLILFSLRKIVLISPIPMAGFFILLIGGICYFVSSRRNGVDDQTANCCNKRA